MIFLCENNQYALSTPAHTVTSGVIADRAAGFGMPGVRVENGQDVLAVYEAVSEAVAPGPRAATARPSSRSSPTATTSTPRACKLGVDYRNKDEKAEWLAQGPDRAVPPAELVRRGVADDAAIDALEAEVPRRSTRRWPSPTPAPTRTRRAPSTTSTPTAFVTHHTFNGSTLATLEAVR